MATGGQRFERIRSQAQNPAAVEEGAFRVVEREGRPRAALTVTRHLLRSDLAAQFAIPDELIDVVARDRETPGAPLPFHANRASVDG
jgi:hypothetical protein